ncbi:site-specific integrase [Virgibacillus sp. Bac332]|uniref:tyrosine-type recombinase/integrase n=1 Tax=Virgibacillus sp. Bac332 TaxID=2419842 RepID=UPI0013CE65A4|nr:site-specific integrase [Virgibacillus sp. Bac332]
MGYYQEQLDHYLKILKTAGRKSSTIKQYSSDLQKFLVWLETYKKEKSFSNLNSIDLQSYIDYLERSNLSITTRKRLLSGVNKLLNLYNIDTQVLSNRIKEYQRVPLRDSDFISENEMSKLLSSMKKNINSSARDELINRNLAIICLIRYYGFKPSDISKINMEMVNLAQCSIDVLHEDRTVTYQLSEEHIQYIQNYLKSIDRMKRPRLKTKDPLFVAYFNLTNEFIYDYSEESPKRLSIRGIQEMIKDEVQLAGLRKISAKHLRNSCILYRLRRGDQDNKIQTYFRLSNTFSLHRYKVYIKANLSE